MKKIIEVAKKNENVFVILLIAISLIGVTLGVKLAVGDELWNFQNVYKIYNGFQIYKDANVICTPLFFYIGNIIFNILGANFFVFRIYNILIFIFYYFMTYKILKQLGINIKISLITILMLIMFGIYTLPRVMANYNTLAMAFSLLGIYLLIKSKCEIITKNIIIQSIICFLVIMTKQNIGMYYFIALTIVVFVRKERHKLIGILQEVGILLILSVLFIISLKVNGILDGFINYTILGMKQFVGNNSLISLPCIIIAISILANNIFVSRFIVKQTKISINIDEKNNLLILNCFSIMFSLIIYPIANITHLLFAINISIILLIYIFNIICNKSNIRLKKSKSFLKIFLFLLILVDVSINVYCFVQWELKIFNKDYTYNYEEPFFGVIIDDDMNEDIEIVTNYIKEKESEGKDVIVFSSKAALYMIPLKQSNGFYDLPFYGNFGNLSEEDIINDLKQKNDILILIDSDTENLIWQENKNIINVIKNEFEYKESINDFDVYTP